MLLPKYPAKALEGPDN